MSSVALAEAAHPTPESIRDHRYAMSTVTNQPSAWSPLRRPVFRGLWIASLASNVGAWMQNVAAAWLMTELSASALNTPPGRRRGESGGTRTRMLAFYKASITAQV